MPDLKTLRRPRRDKREGKSPSTQAGEFVREEIEHIREGKHGARSPRQAIAIGLSKARRAGVDLRPAAKRGHGEAAARRANPRRPAAISRALKREPRATALPRALAVHARAAHTKGPAKRSAAARKAARTRGSHRRS